MRLNNILYTAIIYIAVGVISTILIFVAKGYKIRTDERILEKTGWILVKSAPDGAKTYLDEKPVNPTNTSIGNLPSGTYSLRILKEGYHEWKKSLLVKEEFVTMIDALLIKKAAEIKPVTLTGVREPTADDTRTQIAFYSSGAEKEGIWVYSLVNGSFINSTRVNPRLLAEGREFRNTTQIDWSPNSSEMIVSYTIPGQNAERAVLLSFERTNVPPYPVIDREKIIEDWDQEKILIKGNLVSQLRIPRNMEEIALLPSTLISPDEKKFLYTVNNGSEIEYHVFNLTKPLPIGFPVDTVVLSKNVDDDTRVLWHTTSEHLIVVEDGSISIMEIDGMNKTTIFSVDLASDLVIPTPNGRSIIISTSFTNGDLPNLHSIFFN